MQNAHSNVWAYCATDMLCGYRKVDANETDQRRERFGLFTKLGPRRIEQVHNQTEMEYAIKVIH